MSVPVPEAVAEAWKWWTASIEEDFSFQMKAVVTIAIFFFALGGVIKKLLKVFPDDKDNQQAVSRLVGYIHHVSNIVSTGHAHTHTHTHTHTRTHEIGRAHV